MSVDESSDTDSDYGFTDDMESIKKAWRLSGENPADHPFSFGDTSSEAESDVVEDRDLQLVRSIQARFSVVPMDMEDDWSDSDDYATLRAIQSRFSAGSSEEKGDDILHRPLQVGSTIIDSEKETSNSFLERTNAREGFLNCVDTREATGKEAESCNDADGTLSSNLDDWNGLGTEDVTGLPLKSPHFPKSALAFVDAINQNRSCQKLIRSKLVHMEARMEELNKLMERVKILKNFQCVCKKRTGRALSQKKDAIVQLISVPKLRPNTKVNENKVPAVYRGPPENAHVAYYEEALSKFAINVTRENWSKKEQENLVKGVKQQFQEMLLQRSVDLLSDADGSYDPGNVDSVLRSIKDIDIMPDKIRLFLPKVNWEQLAAMYVPGRSGVECQARFINFDDPLINHNMWTAMEDKKLLHIVQKKGLSNWINIAASLGTNRTPFQCLERYQRSLNASILKREWSKDEDNQLRTAVETYGESNWQVVASVMEGRTGTQCSNRWLKSLHPSRKKVGKWTAEEDKRLKVAVTFFGPKTWKKIARFVPGRTYVQSRERWVNSLDPSLNMAEWAEEEDSELVRAVEEHGYRWSKVAARIPRRTDNQCWRRWKWLFPDEVPILRAAKRIRRSALISNFVDRESERPALGPSDFILPESHCKTGYENIVSSGRKRRRSRVRSKEVSRLNNGNAGEDLQRGSIPRKRRSVNNNAGPSSSCQASPCPDTRLHDMSLDCGRGDQAGDGAPTSDPTEECLSPTQVRKTTKLCPRRRKRSEESGEVTVLKKAKKEKTHFPESMTLMEAFRGIKAMKRKMKT